MIFWESHKDIKTEFSHEIENIIESAMQRTQLQISNFNPLVSMSSGWALQELSPNEIAIGWLVDTWAQVTLSEFH